MEKIKTQRIVYFLLITVFSIAIQPCLYGQDYLPKERENEIKTSGKYFWGEGSDFEEDIAKVTASFDLNDQIIKGAVLQSVQQDEILKSISAGQHFERLQLQGKFKILAWILKDSVFITTQRPITQMNEQPRPVPPASLTDKQEATPVSQPEIASTPTPQPEFTPAPEIHSVATDNPVLQQLAASKNYREFKHIATMNGLVRGELGGGSKGFQNPENCIIAVFTSDGTLSALLDSGGSSRTDLLSGQTIQNPEQYYNQGGYYLWYMQQKKIPYHEAGDIQKAPPIENKKGLWNAIIRLPKNWDGKSVLANGFIFIGLNDKKLQDKYNVHPGQRSPKDGHIYFDENDCASDKCWREDWDDDERFYEYPLSPNVKIMAASYITGNRNLTVAQFADYYKQQDYSHINSETGEETGMVARVTYKNGMITEIFDASY